MDKFLNFQFLFSEVNLVVYAFTVILRKEV